MVTIQATPAEAPAANRQAKTKTEAETGEFRDMLTGALRTNGGGKADKTGKTEAPETEKPVGQTGKPKAKPAKPDEAEETPNPEAVSAMAQQVQQAPQAEAETETGTETQDIAIPDAPIVIPGGKPEQMLKTVAAEDIERSQTLPEQAAEETAPPETQEQQAAEVRAAVQDSPRANERPQRTEAPKTQAPDKRTPDTVQPRQEARTQTEAPTIPREGLEDAVLAKVVAQTPEAVPVESTRPVLRPADAEDARFGEMLTKASRELGQGRTAALMPEESEIPEAVEADPTQEEPQAETQTVIETETETETKADTEAKPAPQTAATVKEAAVRTEQRPLKEMPKTDEAVLGLIQPKPDVTVREAGLREPVPEAQAVRTPDQAEQIRAQVIESLEEDKLEFHMQLQPKELGRVDVKMVLESGKLAMEIVAQSSKSTELLSKQVDGLMASLRLGGVDVASVNVVTARQDADGHMDQMENPYHPGSFQNQAGGESGRSGYGGSGGAGREVADYTEAQPDETRTTPQRLLNYSV